MNDGLVYTKKIRNIRMVVNLSVRAQNTSQRVSVLMGIREGAFK